VLLDEDDYLDHIGTKRHSGRYEWGSGGNVPTHNRTLLQQVDELRKQGVPEKDIANGFGLSTTEMRDLRTIENNRVRQEKIAFAQTLKDKQYSNVAIGKRMGIPEPTVRSLLKDGEAEKAAILTNIANVIRTEVDSGGLIDVGTGVEQHLNISENKLRAAVTLLKTEGYNLYNIKGEQPTTGKQTNIKVLVAPTVTKAEVYRRKGEIRQPIRYFQEGGRTDFGILPPLSISPNRVSINYAENGGDKADGVIFVRPGVSDVSLGGTNYAQVRVKVGDNHYLKGMAIYKNDLPDGVDLVFNTNKKSTGNKLDALKPLKTKDAGDIDADNPFGAMISRQISERHPDGSERLTSVMNIVNEEGDWGSWSKTLSSQMLSKQKPELAKEQLGLAYEQRANEFDKLNSLTNPAIKRKLLISFGDEASAAAIHLKAAALPRQGQRVILPMDSIPPNQIYAPGFRDGERVVLIRHPHGGRFEIPELVVNNKRPEGKRTIGDAPDAVGIHHTVAERLSGADFDGDTVLVIPNNRKKIESSPALDALKDFDARIKYPGYEGMRPLTEGGKQAEMGKISNLITDMTLRNASMDDVAKAIKHSMVVIDAVNHNLDYRRSAVDNSIQALKVKYQQKPDGTGGGASTLISRAKSEQRVTKRIERPAREGGPIDKETGKRVYVDAPNARFTLPSGEVKTRTQASTKLGETDDAFTLSSGTRMESIYAEHSNKLKALGDKARLVAVNTPKAVYNPSARKVYDTEVKQLEAALALVKRNRPLERQANLIAEAKIKARRDEDPDMDAETLKKVRTQAVAAARLKVGAKKSDVEIRITPKQWEAIQAGAITNSRLTEILADADLDVIKDFASPPQTKVMTSARVRQAQGLFARGYTRAEVADHLGISVSTLDASVKVGEDGEG